MKRTLILIAIFAIILQSCGLFKKSQVIIQTKDSLVYVEKLEYKTITLPVDSSLLNAFLECDSNGNVLIKQVEYWNSKAMENQWELENNTFSYKVVYKHDTIKIPYTNTVFIDKKSTEVPVTIHFMYWYEKFMMWAGYILFPLLIIYLAYFIIRKTTIKI